MTDKYSSRRNFLESFTRTLLITTLKKRNIEIPKVLDMTIRKNIEQETSIPLPMLNPAHFIPASKIMPSIIPVKSFHPKSKVPHPLVVPTPSYLPKPRQLETVGGHPDIKVVPISKMSPSILPNKSSKVQERPAVLNHPDEPSNGFEKISSPSSSLVEEIDVDSVPQMQQIHQDGELMQSMKLDSSSNDLTMPVPSAPALSFNIEDPNSSRIKLGINSFRPSPSIATPPGKADKVLQTYPKNSKFESSIVESMTVIGLKKIEPLINDPTVQTIECSGPDKPIIVYRNGRLQPTKIMMSLIEIEQAMKEIADITRIPLMNGVFKAAMPKYIVTAVISGFVGTRFILQKKVSSQNQNQGQQRF
jgi:hypothetical protein